MRCKQSGGAEAKEVQVNFMKGIRGFQVQRSIRPWARGGSSKRSNANSLWAAC